MQAQSKFFSIKTLLPLSLGIAAGAGLALAALVAQPGDLKAGVSNGPQAVQTIKPLSAAPGIRFTRVKTADAGICFTAARNGAAETVCAH